MEEELFGPEWEKSIIKQDKKTIVRLFRSAMQGRASVKCQLAEVDLFENWAKIMIPPETMKKGFHAGYVEVDFTGVQ